jgi:hypothetical protein
MSALERLLAKNGKTLDDFAGRRSAQTRLGRVFRRRGVPKSAELDRIGRLPRRRWQDDPDLGTLGQQLTKWLKTSEGAQTLRPVQVAALQDLHDFGGLFAPIAVGSGKTLLSYLAPTVFGAVRPLLLVPAKLRRKTLTEFDRLREHWIPHPRLELLSYETLSRSAGWDRLAEINPDLIICDEAHRLANTHAGCTRKVRRWMRERDGATRMVAMSGTITTRSLRDYWHIIQWCLPARRCPLPIIWGVVQDWADALDVKIDPKNRLAPGGLLLLASDSELLEPTGDPDEETSRARRVFRRRLTETPGVVATEESALGVSLLIDHVKVSPSSPELVKHYEILHRDWITPDGWEISEAVEIWRHSRELACGFYYVWDPRPPEPWIEARKAWKRFVREILKGNRSGIDTEFQVAQACRHGRLERGLYDAWIAIRDTFKPNTVARWVDDGMLTAAAGWLEENPGICWVEHVQFGTMLADRTGLPYYADQGRAADGSYIEEAKGPVIASIASNSEGRNLQYQWSQNLIVSAPANGRVWEQMLGRTHREGQEADEVSATLGLLCIDQYQAFIAAQNDARYIQDTTGQAQKLLYADQDLPSPGDVANWSTSPLWRE